MKKFIILTIILIVLVSQGFSNIKSFAKSEDIYDKIFFDETEIYSIYSLDNQFLTQTRNPCVGDQFILPSLDKYQIISTIDEQKIGYASKIGTYTVHNVNKGNAKNMLFTNATVAMYLTHNDESFEPTDGYSTIYGKGGIHDVANKLKDEFLSLGVNVALDESLHIPHDSYAYSRSGITAQKLLDSYSPDVIFDIHRDGVSRSTYYTNYNGTEHSRVRMVVGRASANYSIIEEFAVLLMATASQNYPWLFLDIYIANGHYNQGKSEKSLLFEMGTYLIEKEFVFDSCKPLAETISLALFEQTNEVVPPAQEIVVPENVVTNDTVLGQKVLLPIFIGFVAVVLVLIVTVIFKKSKRKGTT
ncbi:MAG: stage II sporulation protein P [Clostridia bacterium]